MSIKNWFENKLAEREAKAEQRKQVAKMKSDVNRSSNHEASKKGHKHAHGIGFITQWTAKIGDKKRTFYYHRDGWNKPIPTNHERVVTSRRTKEAQLLAAKG
jgi:hypothetical protein